MLKVIFSYKQRSCIDGSVFEDKHTWTGSGCYDMYEKRLKASKHDWDFKISLLKDGYVIKSNHEDVGVFYKDEVGD